MKVDWKALYNQLGEVKDAYLDPLLEQPDSREEVLQKLKDRKLGSEWFQEEKRKLNALKNLVPPEGQEWIGNALTETGKFIDDVWGDVRKFEDPKDLRNLPQNIGAVGARGVETFNQGVGLLSEASSFIAHNVLRVDKPVADLGGNVAGFYLTRKLMNKGIGLTNKAIASNTAHNIALGAGKKVNQLSQRFKPVNQRIVDVKAFDPSKRIVAESSATIARKYPWITGNKPQPYAFAYDNSQGGSLLKDASKLAQRTRYEQRVAAGKAELKYLKSINRPGLPQNMIRKIRAAVPPHVKAWVLNNKVLGNNKKQRLEAYEGYKKWLTEGHKDMEAVKETLKPELSKKVAPAIEHTTSLKGDKLKQIEKPNPLVYSYKDPKTGTYKPVIQRGSDDPTAKFIGSSYRNLHQGATDAYTSDQMALLDIPQNWTESAAYYFGFNKNNVGKRLSHSDWMALQSKELSAEQLFSGEKAVNQNIAENIKAIHKVEEGVSIKNRYHPDSTHHKKLSKAKRKIEELTWVDPKNYTTIKLDRKGNIIPPTVPVEIAPGIMVGPNYKPGNDIALDNIIKKLIIDGPLDSSGIQGSSVGALQNILND